MGLDEKGMKRLHKAGIEKSVDHRFVYRFPESDSMPSLDFDSFLADLKKDSRKEAKTAFYLHLPYCTSICSYCHYFKQLPASEKETEAYLRALQKEMVSYSQVLKPKLAAGSVLFGGGTPTFLEAGQLNGLMGFLKQVFSLGKCEATIESSPETLNVKKMSMLRQEFNRLSIGIQDFNDIVLKACNRNHSRKQAFQAVEDAGNAGFDNVNIDLIYGLPKQGLGGWNKTLDAVEELQPESVTASDLRVQKGTGFFSMPRESFASESELVEMHSMFVEKMLSLGYEMSFPYQFVKPGFRMAFLENQWHNGEILGFGASSCSYFLEWDYNNDFPTSDYFRQLEEKGFAVVNGKKLSLRERMKRAMALGLKNASGVEKAWFRKEFGLGLEEAFGEKMALLERLGLIEVNSRQVKLGSKGILFYDAVARKFFSQG